MVAARSGCTTARCTRGSQPREEVVVQVDAETAEWAISDPNEVELCWRKPDQFNEASLRRLPVE